MRSNGGLLADPQNSDCCFHLAALFLLQITHGFICMADCLMQRGFADRLILQIAVYGCNRSPGSSISAAVSAEAVRNDCNDGIPEFKN